MNAMPYRESAAPVVSVHRKPVPGWARAVRASWSVAIVCNLVQLGFDLASPPSGGWVAVHVLNLACLVGALAVAWRFAR